MSNNQAGGPPPEPTGAGWLGTPGRDGLPGWDADAAPGSASAEPQRRSRRRSAAWWGLGGVGIVAVAVTAVLVIVQLGGSGGLGTPGNGASQGTPQASMQFAAGQCLIEAPTSPDQVSQVDCSELHLAEGIGQVDLDVASYATAEINSAAKAGCDELASSTLTQDQLDQVAATLYYPPTRTEWQAGTRTASCVVELKVPVTGSFGDGSVRPGAGMYAVGDCLPAMPATAWDGVSTLDCASEHPVQVISQFQPDASATYDATALDRLAREHCGADRAALGLDESLGQWLYDRWWLPDAGAWQLGERTITCLAEVNTGAALTGSLLDGTAQLQVGNVGVI